MPNEWISVKDKLPKTNGKYLCVCDNCGTSFIIIVNFATNLFKVDEYDFAGKRRRGWYGYDGEWGYYESDDITHWMPLPELPKGEEQCRMS